MGEEKITEKYINYVATASIPKSMTVAEIEQSTERDTTLQAIIHAIQHNRWNVELKSGINKQAFQSLQKVRDELSVTESGKLVLRGTRIVIPQELQKRAIELAHVGHQGIVKTTHLFGRKFGSAESTTW